VLGSRLAVVDTVSNVVTRTIPLPDLDPSALALSPDGTYALVAGRAFSGSSVGLRRIDAVTGAIATSLTYPGEGTPVDLAVRPDGRFAYVSVEPLPRPPPHRWYPTPRPTAAGVVVWDIERQQLVGTIPIGRPQSVAWRPDGCVAYVANGSENVAVIDGADHEILSTVPVGVAQQRIAVTRDGRFAPFVSFGSTIGVIDIASSSVAAMLALGGQPEDIAIGPDNGEPCQGDCDGDGHVTIDEVILGVNIALGRAELTGCPVADDDASGSVGADELVGAVRAALEKCGG
jgi:DNA-binding beta-propeller fold protein YncE